jgi:hypothetical protein
MKRAMLLVSIAVFTVGLAGCVRHFGRHAVSTDTACSQACEGCQSCDASGMVSGDPERDPGLLARCKGRLCHARCRGECAGPEAQAAGPATGTITYPYYTTRGPRDFLAKNPPSIGP